MGWPAGSLPLVAASVVLYAGAELAWEWHTQRRPPELVERGSNVSSLLVGELIRNATLPLRYAVFVAVATVSPLHLTPTVGTFVGGYLAVDLSLYWLHRLLHETRVGWAFHSVHHTSSRFDLSVGGRISWLQHLLDDFFYLPLLLLGLSPGVLLFLLELNRLSQYWAHTEMIGRLGFLDWIFNSPSNHRVHHHLLPGGARRNYGSNFMVWDHLFGTYSPEVGRGPYGTDLGPVGNNPVTIQLAGLKKLLEGRR